jgi:hypothetical protein
VGVVLRLSGERARLVEGALVEQAVDALADGEPSRRMLSLNVCRSAHRSREFLAAADLINFRLPAQLGVLSDREDK